MSLSHPPMPLLLSTNLTKSNKKISVRASQAIKTESIHLQQVTMKEQKANNRHNHVYHHSQYIPHIIHQINLSRRIDGPNRSRKVGDLLSSIFTAVSVDIDVDLAKVCVATLPQAFLDEECLINATKHNRVNDIAFDRQVGQIDIAQ